jgi:UDP-N-acetylmuramate dehydrogenase
MGSDEVTTALVAIASAERVHADAPLAPLTTFGVGGPADWLVDVRSLDELQRILACARMFGVAITVFGGGSNVLVADAGVRGIVVRLRMTGVDQTGPDRVRADAGLTMNGLVRWMVGRGLSGLEAWAGTPGTVGGAIHGNAHYGGHDISEYTLRVAVVTIAGQLREVPAAEMGFGYDTSRLFQTREIVVWAEFKAGQGEPEALRAVARQSLAHRKRTQPLQLPSAGCVFQNPLPGRDEVPAGIPWSAGALVDRAGLKGATVGGATISTVHANFIVTESGATAADVRQLIDEARRAVHDQFGVELKEEIVYLGDV